MNKNKYKIVYTDCEYDEIEIEKNVLKELDCEIVMLQTIEEDKLIEGCKDADALMIIVAPITSRVIKELKKCKVISRAGVGVDTIDVEAASNAGILVCNVPDCNSNEVSDHAIALIMCLGRKIINFYQSVKNGNWDIPAKGKKLIFDFKKLTLGLVGFGKIGRNIYEKMKLIFQNIIVCDPFLSVEIKNKYKVNLKSFDELLRESDFISILCPLNKNNFHLFDYREFRLMKKTSYIINTSRGSIINSKALYDALVNKQIAGAGLDVLEEEPPDFEFKLSKLDNVIITPHAAYYSKSSLECTKYNFALNVLKVLKNEEPINVVNQELLIDKKINKI